MPKLKELIPSFLSLGDEDAATERTMEQDKKLVTWAERTYHRLQEERRPLERQWYVNLAFVFGRQNIAVISSRASTTGFQLTVPKAPPWRVRLIINHIRRIVRTETSKLISQKPRPFVVPNTTEDEDLASARVGEQILESKLSTPEFNKVVRSWVWWGSVCGTSFLKQYWDKDKKDTDGQKGLIDECRVTPFEIFVPNLVEEEIEKQPYVLHATTMTVEEVKRRYDKDVQPNATGVTDMIEDQFLDLVGAQQQTKDKVVVLEFWVKPGGHPDLPKGGMFVVGGGKLLQYKDKFPYDHEEYPFYKFTSVDTGRFYGDSIIVDAIPVQRELNRTRSQIVEFKNLMSKPKLVGYKGSVNAKAITSEPGQFIGVVPGFDFPKPLELAPLPPHIFELETRLQSDLDDISGQHEVTRGENPTQVTAATALSYLQEQDDTKLAYPVASIEDAISKYGRHYLKMVIQWWSTPRAVKVVGRDNIFEVQQWKASDLKGNTDVRVEAGSALPRSKAARQALLMELAKFSPMPHERLMELMDLGGIDKVYEDTLKDKRQAQRENMRMAKLTPETIEAARRKQEELGMFKENTPLIEPHDFDNHEQHIYYHTLFMKDQRYELFPWQVQNEFEMHLLLHRQALMEGIAPKQEEARAQMNGGQPEEPVEPGQEPQQQEVSQQQPQQPSQGFGGQPSG